ncbi:hypothetical protein VC83_09630 [Pseudogymnoascus destructans]|uniref:Uncharacterized protein n=2 Tax=Pseudogymnoascus destructans TaxID=655981 RepID=L8G8U6_PSED2|nr:uncharacterized protein VC83_09630 [Pseudogymnoascus destructans]ELR09063.1 hypothetical protein GMDG_03649 [Pseudogymnoascus destructans 20631-21]PQM43503.1 hypothetical protein VC83_09630 [Pseudogymnoascus destructans]
MIMSWTMICTGGSGLGFKFLPMLGRHVKAQIERTPDNFTSLWKWRVVEEGKLNHRLEQGDMGPTELSSLKMAERVSPKPHIRQRELTDAFRPMCTRRSRRAHHWQMQYCKIVAVECT